MKLNDFPEHIRKRIEAQIRDEDAGKNTKLERDAGNATLGAQEVQRPTSARFLVRIESKRKRLLDEDNLCEKYHVDLLRYSGVIADDSPERTKIEVSQSKAKKGEQEMIAIEVFEITKL